MKNPEDDKTVYRKPKTTGSNVGARPTPVDKTEVKERKITNKADTQTVIRNKQTKSTPQTRASSQRDVTHFKPSQTAKSSETRVKSTNRTSQGKDQQSLAHPNAAAMQHRVLKGRFILEKVLGVGGMGVVYKAKDRLKVEAQDRDPYVAIKVLSDEFKSHPEAFISLQRESRKSQHIAHPNTVKVYDFDRDGDTVFMTMEYMEGKPLDQLIRQYKATGLPPVDAWEIVNGMCSALIHAHAENIVHSDFKPGNVFITNNSIPKIFDFGIARAVASVDRHDGKSIDKTVFDAGNLGALTPAYASLEMLKGKTPDVRDDIYALGCVVYEIFTGEHPFNKIPADEAFNRNLKPKRITTIKKSQWRAIEKALAFKRADRIDSVETFYNQITQKRKRNYTIVGVAILVVALGLVSYFAFLKQEQKGVSEHDIRNELEFSIRFDLYKKEIQKLLNKPDFTLSWEDNLWEEVKGVTELLRTDDKWLISTKQTIYSMYINKIREKRKQLELARTKILIENAYRYTDNPTLLDQEKQLLAEAIKEQSLKKQKYSKKYQEEEIRKVIKTKEEKKRLDSFNLALSNVKQQLKCQSRLNMRDFGIAIEKLKSLYPAKYKKLEPNFVNALASCITEVGKSFPERAVESKKYALRIFKGNRTIAAINIAPREACGLSIAGLGARGKRTLCSDKIGGKLDGPSLVVIPGNGKVRAFAIGKYEISHIEMNKYCKSTNKCAVVSGTQKSMPATGLSINTVKNYLKWLSDKTRQRYRLPTKNEWIYAAKTQKLKLDPNRNCQLSSRGISKGQGLVKATAGKQNSWGLVNYVGNAQEWVYAKGRRLIATGGSYQESMDNCTIDTWKNHSGIPDKVTGFRVLRELKKTR